MVLTLMKTPAMPFRNVVGWLAPERRRAMAAAKKLKALVLKIMTSYRSKGPVHDGTLIQLIMESDAFPTEDKKAAQLLEFLVAGELILNVCGRTQSLVLYSFIRDGHFRTRHHGVQVRL